MARYWARPHLGELRRKAKLRQADVAVFVTEAAEWDKTGEPLTVASYNKIEQGARRASAYHAKEIAAVVNAPISVVFTKINGAS